MSQERIELVRKLFEFYLAGERDEWMQLVHPDVELDVDPAVITSGTFHGRDELEQWGKRWDEMWEALSYEPEQFFEAGEALVVGVRQTSRGAGSGVPVDQVAWWVFHFDGDRVRRILFFTEKESALAAVGLEADET
jgi:ketosteroid isomerase-like protein